MSLFVENINGEVFNVDLRQENFPADSTTYFTLIEDNGKIHCIKDFFYISSPSVSKVLRFTLLDNSIIESTTIADTSQLATVNVLRYFAPFKKLEIRNGSGTLNSCDIKTVYKSY